MRPKQVSAYGHPSPPATRAELARFDKSRKKRKKTSNADWTHPHDPNARVTKMKDGRTLLIAKLPEHRAQRTHFFPSSTNCYAT